MSSLDLLAFGKYQGLGNDFLIIDLRTPYRGPSPEHHDDDSGFSFAKRLCDRRLGVGGDGVLTLTPPSTFESLATMRVLNSDGSEAEMCGNGLRCVAKYLFETHAPRLTSLVVDTGAGPLRCEGHWDGDQVTSVRIDMGAVRWRRTEIPMAASTLDTCQKQSYQVRGRPLEITALSMGNPHAVCFVSESGPTLVTLANDLGASIETHPDFPQRTNAEFAHVHSETSIELVVWERGCGITQACGTGACATVAAACFLGKCPFDTEITVALPGGALVISVAKDYQQVMMRGPVKLVYQGEVCLTGL